MLNTKRNQREDQSASAPASGRLDVARYDGNRDPAPAPAPMAQTQVIDGISNNIKNIDLGAVMWTDARGARHVFQARQPASILGKAIDVQLNAFAVAGVPTKPIYQYQVMVGTGGEKRGLIKKVWSSKAVQDQLGSPSWIFDGNTLAFSMTKLAQPEIRVNVNLDEEAGKPTRGNRSDVHRVIVKYTNTVSFDSLNAYLQGKGDYHKSILQSITVLDHIMREGPTRNFISIKRSFFFEGSKRNNLGGHVEHTNGVYQSLRIAHHPAGHRLVVNADVANGTFWQAGPLSNAVMAVTKLNREAEIGSLLKNRERFYNLKRLRKLRVFAAHRGGVPDDYVIDRFLDRDSSYELTFKDGSKKTVAAYFSETHNIRLKYPGWPLVSMTKKAILPLELLKLKENQRYTFKLDEMQTASMIKLAVTPPKERWAAIDANVKILGWEKDPYLQNYGMKITPTPIVAKARLLTNPKLQFGGSGAASQTDPRTSGRWDLKGKKFVSVPPAQAFTAWGVCVMPSRFNQDVKTPVEKFVQAFVSTYMSHGAALPAAFKAPAIYYASGNDPATCARDAFALAGNKHNARPQILLFVLQDKNSVTYGKIKRFCECNLGIPTQCVQWAHVQKAQPQYISNVLMKFNAKLGGYTNTISSKLSPKLLDAGTVIIGADVSHAAPGLQGPSMAAMTVSMNVQATRYAAAVETNGHRLEMITDENINKHIMNLVGIHWMPKVNQGKAPSTVVYFRDGVSEGQFSQVIDQEVAAMKKTFNNKGMFPKFLVIIASKRHHVRFFPGASGDRNGNALPGTLVETGVTQPFENDFYLCAHAAIKGTARPVHYNVLLNEPAWTNDRIHTLIYEHSYQYIRATTPVSLFPAVYYAHIASNRAAHHSKGFGMPSGIGGATVIEKSAVGSGAPPGPMDQVFEPLMAMANPAGMTNSMWYI